jgi:cell fate regulator YaaT (PSP1 superfamily)
LINIVGVRFKNGGKMYYFDPGKLNLSEGQWCIVETARGKECGEVVQGNREAEEREVVSPLKPVIRIADSADIKKMQTLRRKEEKAFDICTKKIEKLKLDMTVVEVEYTFDESKILFYFTAEGRVDFRELVKELATVFKTRIELRQIGVRDECKMKGGLGMCGRPFCCHSFMGDFHPVSIKMAKEQGLSLNPVKISGTCGRLMCCLNYEQEVYEELNRSLPRVGALIKTPDGNATVAEVNTLKQTVRAALTQKDGTVVYNTYNADSVRVLKGGKNIVSKEEQELLRELEDE